MPGTPKIVLANASEGKLRGTLRFIIQSLASNKQWTRRLATVDSNVDRSSSFGLDKTSA